MVDDITYALMAGDAYLSNRIYVVNRFPVPAGWTPFNHVTRDSGFEAISFVKGNEIVVSFAGTDPDRYLKYRSVSHPSRYCRS